MHTTIVVDDRGEEWVIIHNGDWSGDAIVRRRNARPVGAADFEGEVTLPGFVIKAACRKAIITEVQSRIETALDDYTKECEP